MKKIIIFSLVFGAVIVFGGVWAFVVREPVDPGIVDPIVKEEIIPDFVDPNVKDLVIEESIIKEPIVEDPIIFDPVDPKLVDPGIVDPIVKEEIPLEFELCRKAITRAQLREITGHEDFIFEETEGENPMFGTTKNCDIQLAEIEIKARPEEPKIGIIFLPLEAYETIKGFLPFSDIVPIDIDDIGERAFFAGAEDHPIVIVFIDGDINQTIMVAMNKEIFDREILENLAKQVEKNLR